MCFETEPVGQSTLLLEAQRSHHQLHVYKLIAVSQTRLKPDKSCSFNPNKIGKMNSANWIGVIKIFNCFIYSSEAI